MKCKYEVETCTWEFDEAGVQARCDGCRDDAIKAALDYLDSRPKVFWPAHEKPWREEAQREREAYPRRHNW